MGTTGVLMSEAITEVRELLDETTAAFWTDQQLMDWINQGCQDVQRKAEVLWNRVNQAVLAEEQFYPWPADVYRIHKVVFVPNGSPFMYPLTFMGMVEADQLWGVYQNFPAAWPEEYVLVGTVNNPGQAQPGMNALQIQLFPVPAQSGSLQIDYYRQVIFATSGSDYIDTILGWEDVVYEYAVYKALRKDKDPGWQAAKQEYMQQLQSLIEMTRTFTDMPGIITTGQAQWPPWAFGSSDWY